MLTTQFQVVIMQMALLSNMVALLASGSLICRICNLVIPMLGQKIKWPRPMPLLDTLWSLAIVRCLLETLVAL